VTRFAVRLIKCVQRLSRDAATDTIVRQLIRSGTGISSNYHSACRARSRDEFIAKLGIVVEEADETEHWLKLWRSANLPSGLELEWLAAEASELRAIFCASLKTARLNRQRAKAKSSDTSSNP
jgi:four helix bundle protein